MTEIKLGPTKDELDYLETTYIARELAGDNEESKQPQRERVAEHLLRFHDVRSSMRLFCLPGIRWAFENFMDTLRPPELNDFVGVERNYTILERAAYAMPGGTNYPLVADTRQDGEPLMGRFSNRARVLWAGCGTFMNLGRTSKNGKAARISWARMWKKWTAVWLDFSGPISKEILLSLQRVDQHVSMARPVVPIAVTFMLARELPEITKAINICAKILRVQDGSALEKRVALVRAVLSSRSFRSFKLTDAWQYTSTGGVPMAVVTGLMTERFGTRPEPQKDLMAALGFGALQGEVEPAVAPLQPVVVTPSAPSHSEREHIRIGSEWRRKDAPGRLCSVTDVLRRKLDAEANVHVFSRNGTRGELAVVPSSKFVQEYEPWAQPAPVVVTMLPPEPVAAPAEEVEMPKAKVKKPRAKKAAPKKPAWMDKSKMVSAIFAIEDARSAYGGFVIDLGDGTCRIANDILLGENSLKWGDRVDLFYNPTDPMQRPMIGYRVYDRADDPASPVPGKNYGARREPTKEERERREKEEARREKAQCEQMERHHEGLMAGMDLLTTQGQYTELLVFCAENKLKVPKKLTKLPDTWRVEIKKRRAKEAREAKKSEKAKAQLNAKGTKVV